MGVPSTCPKQGFAAVAGGHQRSGRWGAGLPRGTLTGGPGEPSKLVTWIHACPDGRY
jgi:hypothetical protein